MLSKLRLLLQPRNFFPFIYVGFVYTLMFVAYYLMPLDWAYIMTTPLASITIAMAIDIFIYGCGIAFLLAITIFYMWAIYTIIMRIFG